MIKTISGKVMYASQSQTLNGSSDQIFVVILESESPAFTVIEGHSKYLFFFCIPLKYPSKNASHNMEYYSSQ